MQNKRAYPLKIFVVLLLGAIIYWSNNKIHAYPKKVVEDLYYLPIERYAKLISLGYTNVVADILWMKTLAYTGEHIVTDRNFKYLVDLLNAVTDLDPYFFYPYRFAGTILPWEAHDPNDAIRILKKSLRYLPDKWYLWFLTGFIYMYFKGDYREAAFYFKEAATKPNRPSFIVSLAIKLMAKTNDADTAIKILLEIYNHTKNPHAKAHILRKIKMILAERNFRLIEEALARFKRREGRLPSSLEELVHKGYLSYIPRDPFGGKYYLTPDGKVKNTAYNKRIKIFLRK